MIAPFLMASLMSDQSISRDDHAVPGRPKIGEVALS
jgi:hypothetical protein